MEGYFSCMFFSFQNHRIKIKKGSIAFYLSNVEFVSLGEANFGLIFMDYTFLGLTLKLSITKFY